VWERRAPGYRRAVRALTTLTGRATEYFRGRSPELDPPELPHPVPNSRMAPQHPTIPITIVTVILFKNHMPPALTLGHSP